MTVVPRRSARIVWEEGMYLTPQHFQAQRRHFEDVLSGTVDALYPFTYGITSAALDEDALAGGSLALTFARGVFPDGTVVSVPDVDAAPAVETLADRFSPTRDTHVVLLALPAWQTDAPNVNGARGGAVRARYTESVAALRDDTAGQDVAEVPLAIMNLRLALDHELVAGELGLPLARVRRDGAGRFVIDRDFIPPCLQIGGSERLLSMLTGIVAGLEAKGAALASSLGAQSATSGGAPAAYVGNEIATRWLLHAVRSAEAPLRHLLATRRCHPERLWMELSRLAGALCTFSLTTQARDLPLYAHDDLSGCFGALESHLRTNLDLVVAARAVVMPFTRSSEVLHVVPVPDPRCYQPGARWFLGLRSGVGSAATVARAPELLKVCASKFVLELVRRAYPGLTIEHVPAPPPGLAPRQNMDYFEITLSGPCSQGLNETHELGVYVPDALPEIALELAVLIPS